MTEQKKTKTTTRARKSRAGTRLSTTEKAEAIALWRAGAVTLDELAAQFHRDRSTFARLFNGEGIAKGEGREEHERKVTEAVETTLLADASVTAQRIRETKEEHYRMAKAIAHTTYRIIATAAKNNESIGNKLQDLKAMKTAAETLNITLDQRYKVLGLNDENKADDTPMPDLVVQELTAEEVKEMHQQQVTNEDELGADLGADLDIMGEEGE